jgi:hypothetical protein
MFATPRNQECVSGTGTVCGTGITSLTWCSGTHQFSAPTWKPSFEASAVPVPAVRRRSATESWNSGVARGGAPSPLSQRLDLFQELAFGERLGDVVLGALAKAPDLVGLLVLGGADDDRMCLVFSSRVMARVAWKPFSPASPRPSG